MSILSNVAIVLCMNVAVIVISAIDGWRMRQQVASSWETKGMKGRKHNAKFVFVKPLYLRVEEWWLSGPSTPDQPRLRTEVTSEETKALKS